MKIAFEGTKLTFNGLLTIVFVTLKVTNAINWSWWWVLCPLWIPALLGLSMLILFICVTVSISLYESCSKRRYW